MLLSYRCEGALTCVRHASACLQARRGERECAKCPTATHSHEVSTRLHGTALCASADTPPALRSLARRRSPARHHSSSRDASLRMDTRFRAREAKGLSPWHGCWPIRLSVSQHGVSAQQRHPAKGDGYFRHPAQGKHCSGQGAAQQLGAQASRRSICCCSAGKELVAHFSASRRNQG